MKYNKSEYKIFAIGKLHVHFRKVYVSFAPYL